MPANSSKHIRRLKWLPGLLLALVVLAVLAVSRFLRHRPAAPAAAGVARGAASTGRPNLVLISLDTLRPDHLGCYGYAKPTSPNLDRFATLATRFTNVHCQAPSTLLSHMSLFTSKIPSHNGVDSFDTVLPPGVATLPQLLHDGGYNTAAIVNNCQMQAHWGFNRGFNLWREFEERGSQAPANRITDSALAWVGSHPHEPYFLFLHYFDAHMPYNRPPAYAKAMGSDMGPSEVYKYMLSHLYPGSDPVDADHLQQMEGAYDGAISFVDAQVGRLLAALPSNTAVVIFSDHGEAFREHGRFGHGNSLYEEETRTVLMVKLPGQQALQVENQPVMLMDVAPTLLSLAGIAPPADFEGQDLLPLINGAAWAPRRIPAESRLPIERYAAQSLVLWPWKVVGSNMDGSRELYLLPDETNNLAAQKSTVCQSMFQLLDNWAQERDYWVLYARGPGAYSIDIEPTEGEIILAIASEQPPSGQINDLDVTHPWLTWTPTPGPATKMLYVQLSSPAAVLRFTMRTDGQPAPGDLRVGPSRRVAKSLPVETNLASESLRPLADQPAIMEHDGVLAMRYHGTQASTRSADVKHLDADTINRLRSLGYLK